MGLQPVIHTHKRIGSELVICFVELDNNLLIILSAGNEDHLIQGLGLGIVCTTELNLASGVRAEGGDLGGNRASETTPKSRSE